MKEKNKRVREGETEYRSQKGKNRKSNRQSNSSGIDLPNLEVARDNRTNPRTTKCTRRGREDQRINSKHTSREESPMRREARPRKGHHPNGIIHHKARYHIIPYHCLFLNPLPSMLQRSCHKVPPTSEKPSMRSHPSVHPSPEPLNPRYAVLRLHPRNTQQNQRLATNPAQSLPNRPALTSRGRPSSPRA